MVFGFIGVEIESTDSFVKSQTNCALEMKTGRTDRSRAKPLTPQPDAAGEPQPAARLAVRRGVERGRRERVRALQVDARVRAPIALECPVSENRTVVKASSRMVECVASEHQTLVKARSRVVDV